ncbi:MAG: APC family permease [Candidatus Omnitrophota bacterium]
MPAFIRKIKNIFIGRAKSPLDRDVFHKLSLIAFLAWIGLGADGLSSSCYGPEAAFLALQGHTYLSIFVALASVATVFLISASYSQIIELFPSGGGGYLVASKLLNPTAGMVSGCALLIDYVLTIALSVASGVDALFSFLPPEWMVLKLEVEAVMIIILIVLNMRGVRESVEPLVPIFLTFLITHVVVILYAFISHASQIPTVIMDARLDAQVASSQIGAVGMLILIVRAYTLGAGTYTGIEAVSNGLNILREPRVVTGKRTMRYMSWSLAITVFGLMMGYLLFHVTPQAGKTLNAVLFETMVQGWGKWGSWFVVTILLSEALILFVAAQTGFLGGPRVIANMALDRWFPNKFANLSDRLVTQNGILIMGLAALATLLFARGQVQLLVIFYSINVFITFFLSQLGLVCHWWRSRAKERSWKKKLLVSGTGFLLTTLILTSVVVLKFHEGGWITLFVTGALVVLAVFIKRHYLDVAKMLHRLNTLVHAASVSPSVTDKPVPFDPNSRTAVILVGGFNGLGLHTLFNVTRFFGKEFKNFIFVQVGIIDAGNFKGADEVVNLEAQVKKDLVRYVDFMHRQGSYAESMAYMGVDILEEADKVVAVVSKRFPHAVIFGGQLVFPKETLWNRWLHNDTAFALQRKFYQCGIPFVVLPIRV